jgi:hypothetical protein
MVNSKILLLLLLLLHPRTMTMIDDTGCDSNGR